MMFSSLNNLLLSNRPEEQVVSFSSKEELYWAQFLADVKALTSELKGLDKQRLAICCDDSYHFCVAFFAVIYAQKQMVLPGNHQPEMLNTLSEHFDLILHDGLVSDSFAKPKVLLPLQKNALEADIAFSTLSLSEVEIILFTSGSSGTPKAIRKSLQMLDAEICQLEVVWGKLITQSKIVSTVSHQHIYGLLFRVLWPLCAGRAFQRFDLVYPEQIAAMASDDCSLISSPALLKRLQHDKPEIPYRAIFSSGGPLSFKAVLQCNALFQQAPFEIFGSTETGGIGYRQQLIEAQPWTLFPGINAQLNNESCLKLNSPWVDADGFYQTQDQCELLNNNQFLLKGRIDRIVKIEEKRVSLIEVENRLNQLGWIEESAVMVRDDIHRLSLGAAIKLSALGEETIAELGKGKFWIKLRQALRLWLEPVGIPRHFVIVSEIPVNKQGKRLHSEISLLFKNIKPNKESEIDNATT